MKKISLLTKLMFHISNIGLILIYIYPGSILGWLFYRNIKKQPQISSDFEIFSLNHFYAFMFLSFLGIIAYHKSKYKILFSYLFATSILFELCHIVIPERSFQLHDLTGNFLGVFFIFIIFNIYNFLRKNNYDKKL
ncbi:hypothetical protein [Candidatus Pelagibacter communis]|uniref:hypothetical protein n=1 Tax=Pelagibacter ubique TaxID=198252 RepID=UPI00094DA0FC|nr:hypothetical protein [Candidatus Pelagibacter ubique]|tara:strand:+ start:2048 stop:2455 length:408 start_codon:yes stop_codon:yes gene_type:complete